MSNITEQIGAALADRYRIERHLGEGGMATVFLAHDVKHDRKVALKVLRPELAAVIGAERFLNEIKVTANLQHPHILPLHDSGTVSGDGGPELLFYVMPYVEGESLRDLLAREKQLGIEEGVEIARAVASALDYAHRQGVIHRDIKPENILMHDGQALVADFGIALAVSHAGSSRLTETGLSIGTPHYMSPEQAMGDRELDARSDVYSLGAMLYEMLAGDPPYTGSTAQAIVAKVITEKAPVIDTVRDTVPGNVVAAIAKSLSKLPADRFHSAAEFADALKNPGFTVATMASPSATVGPAASGLARYRWPAIAAVLGLAAVAGWLRPARPDAAPLRRYGLSMPEGEGIVPRYASRLAISPDGSRFVFVGRGEAGVQLWVRERDQLSARPLPGTDAAVHPFFSPTGDAVAFFTPGPATLHTITLAGGPPLALAARGLGIDGGTWSSDGFFYVVGAEDVIVRVPAIGGEVEPVSTLDSAAGDQAHNWPHALPSGRGILMTVATANDVDEFSVAVLDVETGEHRRLVRGVQGRYAVSGHLVYVTADGSVLAAPFDERSLELTGPGVALLEGVSVRAFGSMDFSLAASGSLMYVSGGVTEEPNEMVWVDRDGAARPIDPDWTGEFYTPAISPDGSQLALGIIGDAGRDLWVKQLDRGPLSRITFPQGQDHRPWWTPDGRALLFISDRGETRDAYRKRADGVGQAELVLDLPEPVNQVELSPDGEWLVYRTGRNNVLDIAMRRTNGDTTAVPLIADSSINEHSPTLSPDGRWLAYISDESGRWELYVRPFPDVNAGRWQVSTAGGAEPVWARSGRELFYKNANGQFIAAEVEGGDSFVVVQSTVLFETVGYYNYAFHPQYDVTPDGEQFAMIRFRGAGESGQIVVVDNWFEELRERVPPN
jgi:serine/threonine-protein kinase